MRTRHAGGAAHRLRFRSVGAFRIAAAAFGDSPSQHTPPGLGAGDGVVGDQAFETIGAFADQVRKARIRGYVAKKANDADCAVPPENRPNLSEETEEPTDSPSSEPQDGPSADTAKPSPEPASTTQGSR